jgi:hypothetical protein
VALLELRQALLHARNPRLKLKFVDKTLGVAVNKTLDPVPHIGHLLLQADDLFRLRSAARGLRQPAPVFVGDALRLLQQRFDPPPDDCL